MKLDFDTALEILQSYGYTSTTSHPYIYQKGEEIGLCYSYVDLEYGKLERIKTFEDKESFEQFIKELEWIRTNGQHYNARIILDNYESFNPRVMYLRKEKLMLPGEMDQVETYDFNMARRASMDYVNQVIYEAGDLLLIYDEMKGRQLTYLQKLVELKNSLREKYFELQKEIDKYNRYSVERHLTLLPEIKDNGIDLTMEIAIKDRYNMYLSEMPPLEEAIEFIKDVWRLNKNLEENIKYYNAQIEENNTRNEIKIVDEKLAYIKDLNDDLRTLFGVDIVGKFREINKKHANSGNVISDSLISDKLQMIEKKYSVFDYLRLLDTADYLREAIQNTNYADLSLKYSKDRKDDEVVVNRIPLNDAAIHLSVSYRDNLNLSEQAILTLYNNHKFKILIDAIMSIDNFSTQPLKVILKKLNSIPRFSKIKSECYDSLKKRIDEPVNAAIKKSLFANYDFTTFNSFVTSLVSNVVFLKELNNKVFLNGDINLYTVIKKPDELLMKKFIVVSNDLNSLLMQAKENKASIATILLKTGLPVMYSPYYFDIGDIYSKGASPQMFIKEMVNFEIVVDKDDALITKGEDYVKVVNYQSSLDIVENLSIVEDMKAVQKTNFYKYTFINASTVAVEGQEPVKRPAPVPGVQTLQNNGEVVAPTPVQPVEPPVVQNVSETEKKDDIIEEKKEDNVIPSVVPEQTSNVEVSGQVINEVVNKPVGNEQVNQVVGTQTNPVNKDLVKTPVTASLNGASQNISLATSKVPNDANMVNSSLGMKATNVVSVPNKVVGTPSMVPPVNNKPVINKSVPSPLKSVSTPMKPSAPVAKPGTPAVKPSTPVVKPGTPVVKPAVSKPAPVVNKPGVQPKPVSVSVTKPIAKPVQSVSDPSKPKTVVKKVSSIGKTGKPTIVMKKPDQVNKSN